MTGLDWAAVAVGGLLGGALRGWLTVVLRPDPDRLPWATWIVNLAGSFLLGLVTAMLLPSPALSLLGVGFCGALTTWSTFSLDAVTVLRRGRTADALGYVLLSLGGGLVAAAAGLGLGRLLG